MADAERREASGRPSAVRLPAWEDLRSSLWFFPAVAAAVSFVVATALGSVHPAAGSALARWAWPGDRDAATAFLQVVAGSVITVTSLMFSLVVVALQLASQQFSPRLLREFARDAVTQAVLAVLVSTFAVAVTVLRGLDADEELPSPALLLVFLLVLLSIAALLGFLGHIASIIRIDTMMAAVHGQTRQTIESHYLPFGAERDFPDLPPGAESGGVLVSAVRSGFVQRVHVDRIVDRADACGAVVVMGVRPGDLLVVGTPVARVHVAPERADAMVAAVRSALDVGHERTLEQDAALGLRQLTDIAVKALSPGINDPTTAAHAIGHVADLLVRLQGRRLGPVVHAGRDGRPRVQAPDRDHRYYLDVVVGPVRRYGAGEPTVLVALLRMLRDAALAARDDLQREELRRQAALVVATMSEGLLDDDADQVRDAARRVGLALAGDVDAAYGDRAGETRSM